MCCCGLWFSGPDSKETLRSAGALAMAEIVYFYLRAGTHAISVAHAPDYYRLTWDPIVIAVNVMHYIDRSATSTAVLAVAAAAVYRRKPVFEGQDRRRLVFGLVWFISGLIPILPTHSAARRRWRCAFSRAAALTPGSSCLEPAVR
jgi:hypothetical protein